MAAALRPSWRMSRNPGIPAGLWQLPLRFARDPMPNELVSFFEKVERITPPGAAILVIVPAPWNNPQPSYSRFRISYILADHPVAIASSVEPDAAPYIAFWRTESPAAAGTIVYRGHEGTLVRTSR